MRELIVYWVIVLIAAIVWKYVEVTPYLTYIKNYIGW